VNDIIFIIFYSLTTIHNILNIKKIAEGFKNLSLVIILMFSLVVQPPQAISSCRYCTNNQDCNCQSIPVESFTSNINSLVFLHVTSEIAMLYILKLSEILHDMMLIVSCFLVWSPLASVSCSGIFFLLCFGHLSGSLSRINHQMILDNKVNGVSVLDSNGSLIGILSKTDVTKAISLLDNL